MPDVYGHLRRLAARVYGSQGSDHTLQPTALVHEAYLRIAKTEGSGWTDRQHFFRLAAVAMRQVLTDHARSRGRLKRGGGGKRVQLESLDDKAGEVEVDLSDLHEALRELRSLDERQADIVEMRFLTGMTVEQVATVLGLSDRTVFLDWKMARFWLQERLLRD